MIDDETEFFCEGTKLDASFYLPDSGEGDDDKPLVIPCSGFMGLKDIHPERFARFFTPEGYPCFGFDYRTFGKSDGEPGHVLLESEVRDMVQAAAFANAHPEHGGRDIVILGWGMGGGLILEAAKLIPNVTGLICVNGFYDAERVQREVRTEEDWESFQEWFHQTATETARNGDIPMVDPFKIYPLDPVTQEYVDGELRKNPRFGGEVWFPFAESLLQFRPEADLDHLDSTRLLIVHGGDNRLHPPQEAESLYAKYPGPKQLHWVPQAGHTEWMLDDDPTFQSVVETMLDWMENIDDG